MADALPERVRAMRRAQGLTLQDLAQRSGVSVGMLSEVERGTKNPTVRLAYDIAQALGCSISALLEGPMGSGLLRDEKSGVRRESHNNPLMHGQLEVVVYTLDPAARTGEMAPNRSGTLESLVILDGEVELVLDGEARRFAAGENYSHGVHATEYRNASDAEPCRFLVLVDTTRC